MVTKLVDGSVELAHRRFTDAVHKFTDRQAVWDHGVCRWSPPLYFRVRGALAGVKSSPYGRRMPTSRPPLRTDALDWLTAVDQTVANWHPGAGTIDRLKTMANRPWRPQDCERLDSFTEQLAKWAIAAEAILHEAVTVVPLRGHKCPSCNRQRAFRKRDGEKVGSAALVVSELGVAECLACGASWPLEFLARLLGCAPLPTA